MGTFHDMALAGWDRGRAMPQSTPDIGARAQQLVDALSAASSMAFLIDDADFRSGFASYIAVLCLHFDSTSRQTAPGVREINGIGILLCGWAPVAAIGPSGLNALVAVTPPQITTIDFSAGGVGQLPEGRWSEEFQQIRSGLRRAGWLVMESDASREPIQFEMTHAPASAGDPVTLFDAFFFQDD